MAAGDAHPRGKHAGLVFLGCCCSLAAGDAHPRDKHAGLVKENVLGRAPCPRGMGEVHLWLVVFSLTFTSPMPLRHG